MPATTASRTVTWTKSESGVCLGVAEVRVGKKVRFYGIDAFSPDSSFSGLAFRCVKPDGTKYHTFLSSNGHDDACDCASGCYRPAGACVHVALLRALLGRGLLNG